MPTQHNTSKHHIWAIVPAAGIGKRMQSTIPKQYLPLNDKPILAHTVNRLLSFKAISGLVISLQPHDTRWDELIITSSKPIIRAAGGMERSDSVLNALHALQEHPGFNAQNDWVMVHDAVRPCIVEADIKQLAEQVTQPDGGLLALPVRDTMKRQHHLSNNSVASTVEREGLWHALTPQYFPWRLLKNALEEAASKHLAITDESSAMELAGYSPLLVTGREDNIKVTRPADLQLAELYLSKQGS